MKAEKPRKTASGCSHHASGRVVSPNFRCLRQGVCVSHKALKLVHPTSPASTREDRYKPRFAGTCRALIAPPTTRSSRARRCQPAKTRATSSASPTRYSEPVTTMKGLVFAGDNRFLEIFTSDDFCLRIRGAENFGEFVCIRRPVAGDRHGENFCRQRRENPADVRPIFVRQHAKNENRPLTGKLLFQRRAQCLHARDIVRAVEQNFLAVRSFDKLQSPRPVHFRQAFVDLFFGDGNLLLQHFNRRQRKRGVYFLMFAQQTAAQPSRLLRAGETPALL